MSKVLDFIKKYPRSILYVAGMLFGVFGGFYFWVKSSYAEANAATVYGALAVLCFLSFPVLVYLKASEKGENQK